MSRFLPDDFDANRPLALIAGQEVIPSCGQASQAVRNTLKIDRIER